jgi:hypothetical protein
MVMKVPRYKKNTISYQNISTVAKDAKKEKAMFAQLAKTLLKFLPLS